MARTFEFIGKPRQFKRVKMLDLMEFQENLGKAMEETTDMKEQLLKAGEMVEQMLIPFKAEEMLDAEPDDFYLVQGLHLIHSYIKHGRSDEDIKKLINQIIDTVVANQLSSFGMIQAKAMEQFQSG